MPLQLRTTINTQPWNLGGDANFRDDVTLERIIGRGTDVKFLTVLAMKASAQKMVPLDDVNPALTSAKMVCGANGVNLVGWQAVGDGSYKINVDGVLYDRTGLVFTAVASLSDILLILRADAAGLYDIEYDQVGDTFTFVSKKTGLPASTITVLTTGSAGTDISVAGFLNGSGNGTVTAATGDISTAVPAGILGMDDIAFAAIAAADQDDQKVMTSGKTTKYLDEQFVILEGGLTFETVIPSTGKTIRTMLEDIGFVVRQSENTNQIAPLN